MFARAGPFSFFCFCFCCLNIFQTCPFHHSSLLSFSFLLLLLLSSRVSVLSSTILAVLFFFFFLHLPLSPSPPSSVAASVIHPFPDRFTKRTYLTRTQWPLSLAQIQRRTRRTLSSEQSIATTVTRLTTAHPPPLSAKNTSLPAFPSTAGPCSPLPSCNYFHPTLLPCHHPANTLSF